MSARLPELPASFGITLAAVAGLAFVFAQTGRVVAGTKAARVAAEEVHTKTRRMAEELGAMAALIEEMRTATLPSPTVVAEDVEAMVDLLQRFREGARRTVQAAIMLDRALEASNPYTPTIERMMPGWREQTGPAFRSTLAQFRREAEAMETASRSPALDEQAREILARSLAEAGVEGWAASLPPEDEPLVDEDDVEPIRWDREQGWQPGHA